MAMNERVKALRNHLGLSMKAFGEKLSLSQGNVSLIESGKVNITDRNIKLICSTWNVDENWLRNGEGEMFLPSSSSAIDLLVQKFSFPEICAKLLYTYDALDEERQKAVLDYARAFIASMIRDDAAQVADAIAGPSTEEAPARQQLADALTRELSPTSPPGENETA